jgi:hypothetical protein
MKVFSTALKMLHTDGQTMKKVSVALVQGLFMKAAKRNFVFITDEQIQRLFISLSPISESPRSRRQPALLSPACNKTERLKCKESDLKLNQIRV